MSLSRQIIPAGEVQDEGLPLDAIKTDGGTQSRANVNDQVVNEYAEAIKAGATFPPIVVFYDGKKHWLADGFHRFHAYQKIGREKVAADVRQGTRRDAILHSVGANETHGLRRTRDDKRRAVETLLNDPEWSKWSDREIARQCAVHHTYVGKLRPVTGDNTSEDREYTTKHGTVATMKTAGINAGRNQFQAKASEDNGSITGGAGAVTGEANRLASGRTDAGEAASVSLPTNFDAEREADAIQSPFDSASQEGRAIFLARNNLKSSDGERPIEGAGSERHSAARNGATMEQSDVDGSATARTPAGEDSFALAGQIEPRIKAEIIDGNASLAAREGEKPLHSNSPSADAPAEAVAGNPQAPRPPATADVSDLPVSSSRQVGKAGEVESPPSASPVAKPFVLRPHCLNPDLCAGSGAKHCHRCARAMTEGEAA